MSTSSTTVFCKPVNSVLDYKVDWSNWLNSETIDTSVWSVPDGITVDADSNTTTDATVWLSGGTFGQKYVITNRITTNAIIPRTEEESFIIYIE